MNHFNSRPSARGDVAVNLQLCIHPYFNSRPSARGDKMVTGYEHKVYEFQFTPLREGRHGFFMTCAPAFPFQFTPLREGRRKWSPDYVAAIIISIHAPPRGATFAAWGFVSAETFQFTPLREGRHNAATGLELTATFQFTPLREGRHNHLLLYICPLIYGSQP